jgi:hypothetical protein
MKKFKLHWGWSILLVYITFMLIFLFYFWRSFKELESNELVTKDYYNKELSYGDVIAKKQNADTMRVPVQILATGKGFEIQFPEYARQVDGKIELYKPDNSKLDREIPLQLDENGKQIIEASQLIPGRWNVSIEWQSHNVPYLLEKKMTLK